MTEVIGQYSQMTRSASIRKVRSYSAHVSVCAKYSLRKSGTKRGKLYDAASRIRVGHWNLRRSRAIARLGTERKIPRRGSDDREYSSSDRTRRIDIGPSRRALSEPHQGIQRDMRQPAGRHTRGGTDHPYQKRAATQCAADLEFETNHKASVGI